MDTIETIGYTRTKFLEAGPSGRRQIHLGRFVRTVESFAVRIGSLLERRRSRLALLEMTDEQLKDIGISRCDAYREALRPFWD